MAMYLTKLNIDDRINFNEHIYNSKFNNQGALLGTMMITALVLLLVVTLGQTDAMNITKQVSLESWNYNYYERSWSHIGSVISMTLVDEHYTHSPLCKENETFGFMGYTTWVDAGCRADFDLMFAPEATSEEKCDKLEEDLDAANTLWEQKMDALKEATRVEIENLNATIGELTTLVVSLIPAPLTPVLTIIREFAGDTIFIDASIMYVCESETEETSEPTYVFYKNEIEVARSTGNEYNSGRLGLSDSGAVYTCTFGQKNNAKISDESNAFTITVEDPCVHAGVVNGLTPDLSAYGCEYFYVCTDSAMVSNLKCPGTLKYDENIGKCSQTFVCPREDK